MDSITYQKKLAEFDEKAAFHRMQMDQAEHDKALFVLGVLDATQKDRAEKTQIQKEEENNAG